MKRRFIWWAALAAIGVVLATACMYPGLPARIPSHWNGAGQVDGYGPHSGIFIEPVLLVLLALAWPVLRDVSPKRYRVDGFDATWWFTGIALVALLAYIQCVLLWELRTGSVHLPRALMGGVCLALVVIGNGMGKVRRNFWLGVRTPWTLADERVWYATHRLAGKTLTGAGVLALAAVWSGLPVGVATGLIVLGAVVPAAYSLLVWRRLDKTA